MKTRTEFSSLRVIWIAFLCLPPPLYGPTRCLGVASAVSSEGVARSSHRSSDWTQCCRLWPP